MLVTCSVVTSQLLTEGYAVLDLPDDSVLSTIQRLVNDHEPSLSGLDSSDLYHSALLELQNNINLLRPQESFAKELAVSIADLVGSLNMGISSTVYCRGVRPSSTTNVMVECIPVHREIFYTDLEYANHQFNLHIPVKNYNNQTCMYFYPRTHTIPDSDLLLEKLDSVTSGVSRYSNGHSLGLPYHPKIIANLESLGDPEPCPAKPGQAFVFDSKLLHGGGVNYSNSIRFSLDFAVLPFQYISQQKQYHHASYNGGAHFYPFSL